MDCKSLFFGIVQCTDMNEFFIYLVFAAIQFENISKNIEAFFFIF